MKSKVRIQRLGFKAISPLLLVLAVLLSLLLMFWQQSSQQHQVASNETGFQQHRYQAIQASLTKAIQREQNLLAALADSPSLQSRLTNPQELSVWLKQLQQSLPDVERLCVLFTIPSAPQNNACLPISFATLASLRQLQDKAQSDIAMMQPGSDSAHIVISQRLNALEKYPEASLVMVLKSTWLDEQIDDSYVAGGYLQVTQGQSKPISLTAFGAPQYKQAGPLFSQSLTDSAWTLSYWAQPSSSSSSWLLMLAISIVLVLLWLVRDVFLSRALQGDAESLLTQLQDLERQQMKPDYALISEDFQRVSDRLHDAVIPKRQDTIPKPQPPQAAPTLTTITPDLTETHPGLEVEETPSEAEEIVEQALEQAAKKESGSDSLSEMALSFDPPTEPAKDNELEFILPFDDDSATESKSSAEAKSELPDEAIFRQYDVRGKVGPQLNADVMLQLGKAVGSEAIEQAQKKLVLGRDGRLSSDSLAEAFIQGVLSTGCDVIDIGLVPSPMVYFACEHLDTHTGAMITGSHNPADYNGLKVVIAGKTLLGESVKGLYERIRDNRMKQGQGALTKEDVKQAYIDRIKGEISLSRKMHVVIDSGNGVAGNVAPDLFKALGCDVTELYSEVDGSFPNHHPDPGQPENLQDLILTVKAQKADLGLAYDGDGDRLGVVDAQGNIIWPDRLLLLMAQSLLAEQPGATILYDVKSTSMLEEVITRAGGTPVMTPSGHSVIKKLMQEHDAMLAGEMTGHFFFRDRWYGFDDALYSAARLLELLAADPLERTPSEVFAALPSKVSTPEIIFKMSEGESHRFIEQFMAKAEFVGGKRTNVDGVRVDYPHGWGLVRASNTVPGLTLRFEAGTEAELEQIKQEFIQQMLQVKPTLSLLF